MATKARVAHSLAPRTEDPLYVRSIEKAFRVLTTFDSAHPTLSLSQVAAAADLDKSAAQRFTYTLERLGYLRKDPETKRLSLTSRALDLAYHYTRANPLVARAVPYLRHLSTESEETVSLTELEGTDIIYLSRFNSAHMLDTDVIVGSRLPAYCTAPGIAMLSRLPIEEAHALLRRTELRPYTPRTVWRMPELLARLEQAAEWGYAIAVEEIYPNDISIGTAILDGRGMVRGALSIGVSRLRSTPEAAEKRFAPMLTAAALALSLG